MSAPPSSLVPVAYGQGNHTHSLKHLKFHGILILVQPNNLEMFAGAALVETKIEVNCWAAETVNIDELEQSVKNIFVWAHDCLSECKLLWIHYFMPMFLVYVQL